MLWSAGTHKKEVLPQLIMAAPCEVFYVAMEGGWANITFVSNCGKMAIKTYAFLNIVYGNEGLSHVCLSSTPLRETEGRDLTFNWSGGQRSLKLLLYKR